MYVSVIPADLVSWRILGEHRRSSGPNDDDGDMDGPTAAAGTDPRADFLRLYDVALPQVYGYLLRRCGSRDTAEDLTSETFLAAVDTPRWPLDVAWLIGVARHKLADHWRAVGKDQRNLRAVATDPTVGGDEDDPWDARLDALHAHDVLERLAPQHRLSLTLRYVDDLPVPDVALLLERTVPATEALLVRARREFRSVYTTSDPPAERLDAPTEGEGKTR